jgi:hypothetical protein
MINKPVPSVWSLSKIIMLAVVVIFTIGGAGCKSKKKAMEAERAAKEKARLEQEMADKQKREEEERRMKEAEERARREEEETRSREATKGPAAKLDQYFNAIAGSGNVASANSTINEALALFASPGTPVLIVISEEGGEKDYDRPTTIKDYLNYLKDQKKSINKIGNLQFDNSGKITEVELIKQK